MNANKQDVGGLPELPEPAKRPFYFCNKCGHMGEVGPSHVRTDGTACDYHAATQGSFYTEEQMRAYGELCRAAPAGGDAEVVRLRQLLAGTQEQFRVVSELLERNQAHHERMMKLMDSAPAGSGEVEELAQRLDGYEQRSACMAHWSTQSGQRDDADYWSQHAKDMNTAAALLRKLQQGEE